MTGNDKYDQVYLDQDIVQTKQRKHNILTFRTGYARIRKR